MIAKHRYAKNKDMKEPRKSKIKVVAERQGTKINNVWKTLPIQGKELKNIDNKIIVLTTTIAMKNGIETSKDNHSDFQFL